MRSVSVFCLAAWTTLALAAASAEEASQTDWSGGLDLNGPVLEWSNGFASSQALDWASLPGAITLLTALPAEHEITTSISEPAGVEGADLDGDTDLDIVAVAFQGHAVIWYANDGSGASWAEHPIVSGFTGACAVHACDLDLDLDMDVVAAAEHADKVAWWENDGTGGGWTEHVVDAAIDSPFSICAADFDNDTDSDLLSAAFGAGDIVWWENLDGSAGTWLKHTVDDAFLGAWWAIAEDIDGDTDVDIVGAAYTGNTVSWWENDGFGGGWIERTVAASFPNPVNVRAADIDGDTDPDVVMVNTRGKIVWCENDGAGGGWIRHTVAQGLGFPFAGRVADIDGDGDQDIASNEREGDRVMWFENVDALGLLWLRHDVDQTCDGPNDVLIADVDGDTRMDIVATFSWENRVAWYEPSDAYAAGGSLESVVLDLGSTDHEWGGITWICSEPPATSAHVAVRASADYHEMGSWVEIAAAGDDLSAYVADGLRYFQYGITLESSTGAVTPSLEEIRIVWGAPGAVDEDAALPGSVPTCFPAGNPCPAEAVRICFSLPRPCVVDLALFDTSGRRVGTIATGSYDRGDHAATIHGLPGGVYAYRMRAEGVQRTGKLIVR